MQRVKYHHKLVVSCRFCFLAANSAIHEGSSVELPPTGAIVFGLGFVSFLAAFGSSLVSTAAEPLWTPPKELTWFTGWCALSNAPSCFALFFKLLFENNCGVSFLSSTLGFDAGVEMSRVPITTSSWTCFSLSSALLGNLGDFGATLGADFPVAARVLSVVDEDFESASTRRLQVVRCWWRDVSCRLRWQNSSRWRC